MIVVHHNPDCGTSRNVLAILRATGEEPVVIDYLRTGWTRGQLLGLFAAAGVTAREALRVKGTEAAALGLTDAATPEDAILAAMVAHPELVNRPFVCAPGGVRLCRPSHTVTDLTGRSPEGEVRDAEGTVIWPPAD